MTSLADCPVYATCELRSSAARQMHWRLVEWGNIMLRGSASGARLEWESDSKRRVEWSGEQQLAAFALHSRVIRLPEVRQRIVLQVFYHAGEASYWDELDTEKQQETERELAREVNHRIRIFAATVQERPIPIHWRDLETIRQRCILALVNSEMPQRHINHTESP